MNIERDKGCEATCTMLSTQQVLCDQILSLTPPAELVNPANACRDPDDTVGEGPLCLEAWSGAWELETGDSWEERPMSFFTPELWPS